MRKQGETRGRRGTRIGRVCRCIKARAFMSEHGRFAVASAFEPNERPLAVFLFGLWCNFAVLFSGLGAGRSGGRRPYSSAPAFGA